MDLVTERTMPSTVCMGLAIGLPEPCQESVSIARPWKDPRSQLLGPLPTALDGTVFVDRRLNTKHSETIEDFLARRLFFAYENCIPSVCKPDRSTERLLNYEQNHISVISNDPGHASG